MKGAGIVTLLSVGAVSVAPAPQSREPSLAVTEKSAAAFANCFAKHRPGVPTAKDGYSITITDKGTRREILLRGAAPGGPQMKAVDQCI
jgi:hypothetical protein